MSNSTNAVAHGRAVLGALPYLVRAYAGRYGIKLVIGASGPPRTDGGTIWLPTVLAPANPDDWPALDRYADILLGLIDHEGAGHVPHTDFNAAKRGITSEQQRGMWNVFEDVYIERAAIAESPGMCGSLDRVLQRFVDDGLFSAPPEDAPPGVQLQNYVLLRARERCRDQTILTPAREAMEPRMEALFGKRAMIRLKALIDQADALTSTRDALGLAQRVLTMLEEEANAPPDPPPPPEPEPESDPDAGDDAGTPQGGQQGESGTQPTQGNPTTPDPAAADPAPTPTQQQAIREALADNDPSHAAKDFGDVLAEALQDEADTLIQSGQASPSQAGSPDTGTRPPILDHKPLDLAAIGLAAAQTRLVLFSELEAAVHQEVRVSDEGDEFDDEQLHELMLPRPDIFRETDERLALNCAVHLLVDVSGSMDGQAISVAREAAFASAQALSALEGVVVAAGTFPGNSVICDFEEPVAPRAQQFQLATYGGTPMGDAIGWATTRLLAREESRKVLVVITDGQPDNRGEAVRNTAMAKSIGIECIGVGIGAGGPAVRGLFQRHTSITQLSELSGALWGALRTTLLDALEPA